MLTKYAKEILKEMIENEENSDYWIQKFDKFTIKEDSFCRSCFKELSDVGFINVKWADNAPYFISITSKGYEFFEKINSTTPNESDNPYSALIMIERAQDILKTEYVVPERGIIVPDYISGPKYNKWKNDLKITRSQISDECPLKSELDNDKFYRDSSVSTVKQIVGLLESIREWEKYHKPTEEKVISMKEYDVFISHANGDKLSYVDDLYKSLKKLGVRIFYDSEELSWGDNWKNVILEGTKQSEFAIIVISKNFFGREWTEKELNQFLKQQNETGQKIVLPLLVDITIDQLKDKYPSLSEIQAISSAKFSQDEVSLLFAKELIKRLR